MEMQSQRQRPRPGVPAMDLTSKELAAVIQEASRRQGQELRQAGASSLASVDDAFALAEELGIPEEHVRAALLTQQRKKASSGGGLLKSAVLAGVGGAATAVGLTLLGLPGLLALPAGAIVAAGVFAVVYVADLMKRNPEKAAGPPPVPGTCRVCFRPAHAPESTFCEEHRYKPSGPSESSAP